MIIHLSNTRVYHIELKWCKNRPTESILMGCLKKFKNESTDLHLGMESQHCYIGALVLDRDPERSLNHSIVYHCQMHLDSQADILKLNCYQEDC